MKIICHFLITIIEMIRGSKIRKMGRRIQIMYSNFFIFSNLTFRLDWGGEHPTTDIPAEVISLMGTKNK